MPPRTMTRVMPEAATPTTAVCRAMVTRLAGRAKVSGERTTKSRYTQHQRHERAEPGAAVRLHDASACASMSTVRASRPLRGARRAQLAAAHDGDAVAHAEELGQVARHEQHRLAGERQAIDEAVDLRLAADVDAARGLVEEEDVDVVVEQAGERDLLLVAAGEIADALAFALAADAELGDPA